MLKSSQPIKLGNLNRVRLENIFHRLFAAAQIDLTIEDRFGHPVKPSGGFLRRFRLLTKQFSEFRTIDNRRNL